ncbi:MAG: magnesium chelatase, partial [Deltaproteobacteria bacterium]
NIVEREGISYLHPAKFILIGTMNPEEGELRPQLLDRFGMCIQIEGINNIDERVELIKLRESFDRDPAKFIMSYQKRQNELSQRIIQARRRFSKVKISDKIIYLCSKLAKEAFVAGHRADIIMRKVALAIASWEGRDEVIKEDVYQAAELVLFHRKREYTPPSSPPKPQEKEDSGEESPRDERELEKEKKRQEDRNQQQVESKEERSGEEKNKDESENNISVTLMNDTIFHIGDSFKVKRIQAERDWILRKGSGRRSRTRTPSKAGKYIMSKMQKETNDLALDATLRAAAPHQIKRKRKNVAIAIEKSDIREKVRERKVGNFIVFVVDASGSMGAGKRMIEAKGAILSLLLDAYQKRDKIAMIAFRGDHAEVLLPPTNSIDLAHKLLEELPTGGKTPLCHGISLGYQLIQSYFQKDPYIYPLFILISDGKANVSQYGGNPFVEAMEVAEEIRNDSRVNAVVVDVEKSGLISFGLADQLANRMGAKYFKIEDLKADTLVEILRKDLLV